MITILQERPEGIKEFSANPSQFQVTFRTPLKGLSRFVSIALSSVQLDRAVLSTFEIVFEPRCTLKLLAGLSIEPENHSEFHFRADGRSSVAHLLEAALGDWIDFAFVSAPLSFAIYADHDEYITFYSNDSLTVKGLASNLEAAGFSLVKDYERLLDRWNTPC